MKKKINLNEIIEKYETYVSLGQPYNTNPIFLKENVKELCLEFGKQLLELATENANDYYSDSDEKLDESLKQSILDAINRIII